LSSSDSSDSKVEVLASMDAAMMTEGREERGYDDVQQYLSIG